MRKTILLAGLIVLTAGQTGVMTDSRPFRQSSVHGLVSIEVENWHAHQPAGGFGWEPDSTLGSSGPGALVALPNTGAVVDSNVDANSPRVEFQVNFVARGWHHVWVRGLGPTVSDDSVWVGINGVPATTVNIHDNTWGWSHDDEAGRRARLRVPSVGVHTVSIWMREDGTKIDKLVLVSDRFEPCGVGPDESPHDPALDAAYADYVASLPTSCTAIVNQPPVVSAGPDQQALQPTTLTLTGAVSDDGLPTGTLTAAWSQLSGPDTVAFSAPASSVTDATFPSVGVYALRLTASDGELSASDDVSVTIHSPPDLRVDAVTTPEVDPQTLEITAPGSITYTNLGGPTLTSYSLLLWEDRDGDGLFDGTVDNFLGMIDESTSIGTGETKTVAIGSSGSLLFAGNVVYAFVDSSNALNEVDETNNIGNSAPLCQLRGPERAFAPSIKWAWTATGTLPESREVIMTPAVADLTGDGVPDVVFSTYITNNAVGNLRAVDGRTGAELFTITNTAHQVAALSQVAIGDIDGDAQAEIIALGNAGPTLAAGDSVIVFEHDGSFKWQTDLNQAYMAGGPAIADLDGDGTPEIVVGRHALNADGTIRWIGTDGSGNHTRGALAIVADLDLDGVPEVVTGRQAYRADGTVYWRNNVHDGLDAVGNFDDDPFPEVVVGGLGTIFLLEHDGTIKWTASASMLGGNGGPITIADFDNDDVAEIGRAGSSAFGVFRGSDGVLLWSAPVTAVQTSVIGAAAFDLDGDGTREAVITDEWGLRVYRGSDGVELFSTPLGMCTGYTMPIIADVDADGRADIISGANTSCSLGNTEYGLRVYSDDLWRGTGPIWNQHTYHITNVNDDVTIPAQEAESWLMDNSYRAAQTAACPFSIPDLTASNLTKTAEGGVTTLRVRIGNAGTRAVPPSVPVAFYDGDPRAGGVFLGVAHTSSYLDGGTFESVSLELITPATSGTVWVAADDDGMGGTRIYEENEVNNLFDSGVRVP